MANENLVEVYVELFEEGTDTFRPTQAVDLGNGVYRLLPTYNYDPEDEIWEFVPGSIVKCKQGIGSKGQSLLVAYERIID